MAHDHNHDHGDMLDSLKAEYQELLSHSGQGMYIYFDDTQKICNKNFSSLLGYASEQEWARITTPFPEAFVDDSSQETLVHAYQHAMEHGIGSSNVIVWKKKDGHTVKTTVILVPIVHDGHLFALHFVTPFPRK